MLRESVSYIAAFMKGQGNKSPGCFVPGRAFPGTESHLEPSLATARGTAIFAPLDEISFTVEANTTEGFPNREGVLGLPTINVMRGARQDNTKRLKRDANLHLLDFALLKDATTQHFHDTLQPLGDDDWVLEYLALGWSNESVPIKDNGYLKVAVTSLRIRGVSDFPHGVGSCSRESEIY